MNAVCTIVAKNYLSQARTLGDSLKKTNPDLDFYILLADSAEGDIDLTKEKHKTIEVKDIEIPFLKEMAFKYNVLEFCTAVKPFFIEWLFNKYNYEKIIYLDPDIYVYDSLQCIYDDLNENFLVITPHIVNIDLEYRGGFSEEELLFVGIYNLGFAAIKNDEQGRFFVKWWCNRLKDKCYADREDALHVDQKWIDFIPSFFEKGVLISKNMGYNAAMWNIHEKELSAENGAYYFQNKAGNNEKYKLIFFHFSGFQPNTPETMCRKQTKYNLNNKPEYREMFTNYAKEMIDNGFNELVKLKYFYDRYDNGVYITQFQRRLYRKTLEGGKYYSDPFYTGRDSFYEMMNSKGLILNDKAGSFNSLKINTYPKLDSKLKKFESFMTVVRKIIGTKKYFLIVKLMSKYYRPENQEFLIKNK